MSKQSRNSYRRIFLGVALCVLPTLSARAANPGAAQWIAPAGSATSGVWDFRKVVPLTTLPVRMPVHVSADNRFQLFVNGQRVGEGPARGELQHWRYETYDIAPLLHAGNNVIAARVWNFGDQTPEAQISLRTGFVLWSDDPLASVLDTGTDWQVRAETAWRYEPAGPPTNSNTGPDELVDGETYDWAWATAGDTAQWSTATTIGAPAFAPEPLVPESPATTWQLMADTLPAMQSSLESAGTVVRTSGFDASTGPGVVKGFPQQPLTIPAHTHVTLLLDHGVLTTAYPQLTTIGGAGARVRLDYTEALYDEHNQKGNRNEIAGKHMDPRAMHDVFTLGGGKTAETFEPLWWRAWRYMQVEVETADAPVTIESLRARFTAYPFAERAAFASSDPELAKIWNVGWRTIRADAHETFMDCPYYEQVQYIGDTRIESLVSYVVSGDDRLARQALLAFADTAMPDGLTHSRGPAKEKQVIPPFSLLWIGMQHDFWMYRPDTTTTLRDMLPRTRAVLGYFRALQRPDGLLGKLPARSFDLWNFMDWSTPFPGGVPPQDADGGSIPLSLQFAAALADAADLEDAMGDKTHAEADRADAKRIAAAAYRAAWDPRAGLLADTPAKTSFSQHANILGVNTGAIPSAQQRAVLRTVLRNGLESATSTDSVTAAVADHGGTRPATPQLAPASYYFRFYLARALDHAGMDNLYLQTLGPWRHMLALGLTTWAEQPEPTRSDAHAWSAHPNYDLLTLVAGIRPAAPGFAQVLIAPHLGALTQLDATMPHPDGPIHVRYRRENGRLDATIDLPPGLNGTFKLGETTRPLHSGTQQFSVADSNGTR